MDKKSILLKVKELFASNEEKFEGTDYKTQDGRVVRVMGGMDVGTEVTEITEEGEITIADGNYILEDGMVLMIHGGKITEVTEIEDKEEEMGDMKDEVKMEDLETELMDGTKVKVIGGLLEVGSKVEVEIDGKFIPAPEGQHNLKDGRVIYVDADGLINEIQTPDTKKEDEVGMNEEMNEVFNSIKLLVDEVKSLKTQLGEVKKENEELKSKFSKFSKEPSEEPTKHEIKFTKMTKEDRLKFFGNKK